MLSVHATSLRAASTQDQPYTLVCRPSRTPAELASWIVLPNGMAPNATPIIAVHGIRRRARQQAALLAARAARVGRPILAPIFETHRWPRYQQAVRRGRADLALLSLLVDLESEGVMQTQTFDLCGYSGGAQFAHRFAMLHPDRVERLTLAAAGWYTFPDRATFPYGLTPAPALADGAPDPWTSVTDRHLDTFLQLPIQVCVGADDTERDARTRTGDAIDAQQGPHRLARAIRWSEGVREAAHARGIKARVSFIALSGCGHDFQQCVIRGGLDRVIIPDADTNVARPSAGGLEAVT